MSTGSASPTQRMVVDTDVLIDYLRGHPAAADWIENQQATLLISAITVAELYAGVREGDERAALERFLAGFQIIGVDTDIAERGGLIRRDWRKSHGVGLADAMIAATAEREGAQMVSLNKAHFPTLPCTQVPYVKN